jgi:hypothetical protein
VPDSGREKRVVELSRPAFRQNAAEHARTETAIGLARALQAVATVIAKLRDMGGDQAGIAQVVGRIVAEQAKMKADIRVIQTDLTAILDSQTVADQKLDIITVNQANILVEIAATHS